MTARDRSRGYVPDGLFPEGPTTNRVLVGPADAPRVLKHGDADEHNRTGTWQWVQIGGDPPPDASARIDETEEHWSVFRGHHVLIDIAYRQTNRREVNEWKGRDEVRAEGVWVIRFNRTQVWEGLYTRDFTQDLLTIQNTIRRLLDHDAVDWMSQVPYATQLLGRKVWYRKTPAVVTMVLLDQGCVILRPDGASEFPPAQYELDRLNDEHRPDRDHDEVKVDLLDSGVWWWRNEG